MDFTTWIPLDLDLIGYGYPFNLDPIGLDLLDRKLEDNPNPIGLVERNGRTIAAAAAAFGRWPSAVGPQAALLLNPHGLLPALRSGGPHECAPRTLAPRRARRRRVVMCVVSRGSAGAKVNVKVGCLCSASNLR